MTRNSRALRIVLTAHTDLASVETAWRLLEPRADCSFFGSWAWVGCLAERRFPDPVLLQATWRGRIVAMGLLNRNGWRLEPDTLWLGESGESELDAVFVEHNGLLVERGWSDALATHCLGWLAAGPLDERGAWRGRRVRLNGVDQPVLTGLRRGGAGVAVTAERIAPFVDLTAIRASGRRFVDGLSANTRHQIRRSTRRYAEAGEVRLDRADTVAQALDYLDALAALHQESWQRRHKPGAFANPAFLAFHRALILRGFADDTIDLLRVAAGSNAIGYLYNFRFRGRISAYQSGFAHAPDAPHLKPGLTSHAIAIEAALAAGCTAYDFLAGDSQYKRSLSNAAAPLYWVEAFPRCSTRKITRPLRRILARN
jgi:CelD/BcsL family acetyltransferase involved in cellulose biosynthesis